MLKSFLAVKIRESLVVIAVVIYVWRCDLSLFVRIFNYCLTHRFYVFIYSVYCWDAQFRIFYLSRVNTIFIQKLNAELFFSQTLNFYLKTFILTQTCRLLTVLLEVRFLTFLVVIHKYIIWIIFKLYYNISLVLCLASIMV